MASFRLVIQSGPTKGTSYPLDKAEAFIGRDLGNDIVINDPEVSRKHSRVFRQGSNFVIEDQGSTNGTSIGGQRLIGPGLLRPGDVIVLGEHVSLLFETAQLDPDATYVSAGVIHPPAAQVYAQPTPEVPPTAQYLQPQPQQLPPQQYSPEIPKPGFAGQVPQGPVIEEPETKKKFPIWIVIVIILLLVALCSCIAVFIIDSQDMWCSLLGWLFNIVTPGVCP